MSLPHFYLEQQVLEGLESEQFALELSADDAHHARVARLSAGEHLAVIDAANDYFECEIVDYSGDLPLVRIAAKLDAAPSRAQVVLAQGLAKGEKLEMVIRHGTELGIDAFIPFKARRSIVKLDAKKAQSRTARWNSIAKSAAMQSGQTVIPPVQEPFTLKQLCDFAATCVLVLVCWEEAPTSSRISSVVRACAGELRANADAKVLVVVGPEGGLEEAEVEALLSSSRQAYLVSLGLSILRTETAGIVAPALVLYELGALGGPAEAE